MSSRAPASSKAFLVSVSQVILQSSVPDVAAFWYISQDFDSLRSHLLARGRKTPARPYLNLAIGLLGAWGTQMHKAALKDNALLCLALALQLGLEDASEYRRAEQLLFGPPLARPDTQARLRSFVRPDRTKN